VIYFKNGMAHLRPGPTPETREESPRLREPA